MIHNSTPRPTRPHPAQRRSMRWLAVAVLALAATAGACSSDTTDEGAPQPAESASPTTPATALPVVDDFCAVAKELYATLPLGADGRPHGPASWAPADVEAYFTTNVEYLDRLAALAPGVVPDEVTAALGRLDDATTELLAQLEAVDFSPEPAAASASDPALREDRATFEAYLASACGLT